MENTMLAMNTEGKLMTIADYEARIHLYREQIGVGYIGIGRTLIEAKEADVVPHGEWEAWVTRNTGLTMRQAQRCMQAAREIRDGSALAKLEMSKALMLLSSGLDEDTQEEIAERTAEEGATVKALRAEIEKQKARMAKQDETILDQASEVASAQAAQRSAIEAKKDAEAKVEELADTAKALSETLQITRNENQRLRNDMASQVDTKVSERMQEMVAARDTMEKVLRDELDKAAEREKELQHKLGIAENDRIYIENLMRREKSKLDLLSYDSGAHDAREKAQKEIDDLKAELAAAEAREEKRAAELEKLRQEHTQREMDDARGLATTALTGFDLAAAVRAFIGIAGVLPQMGATIRAASPEEQETIRQNVETIAAWVDGARIALGGYIMADGARVM